ncbi:MAG TPA: hypothetical protein P5137_08420 [Candidatus Brocadiia bacterium]|nr:hypothetical protein [Candidatus Brocadiia bacterium]
MSIEVRCGGCGAEFTTDDEFAGQMAVCPECRHEIRIPSPRSAPAPAAAHGSDAQPPETTAKTVSAQPTVPTPAPPSPHRSAPPTAPASPAAPQPQTKIGAGLQIAVAALVAFAMVEIIQVAMNAIRRPHPVTVRTVAANLADRAKAVASARPATPVSHAGRQDMASVRSVALLALALAMGLLAFRLLLRSAALTTAAGTSGPGLVGACFHAGALAGLVCLLAWAASSAKTPAASDGMVAGLLGAWLVAAALVSLVAFFACGRTCPHYFGQFICDAVFGAAVLAYLTCYQRIPVPFSRVSCVAVALLLNSAVDFTLSARFVLRNRAAGGLFRRAVFLVVSIVLVAVVAWTLSVFDKPAPSSLRPAPAAASPAR